MSYNIRGSIYDLETSFQIHLTVPGYREEEITIQSEGNRVTIQGKTSSRVDGTPIYEEFEIPPSFTRYVTFRGGLRDVDFDQAKATLREGILTITLPKKPGAVKVIPVKNS